MRPEFSQVLFKGLQSRIDYILDRDGAHALDDLKVTYRCVGVNQPDDLVGLALMLKKAQSGAGRRRKFVAWELSVHPATEKGPKSAFASPAEMGEVASELVRQFSGCYVLIGFHGLRDLHLLALNWGATGLGLRSYLPNRSNPRRVLVAVTESLERKLTAKRLLRGDVSFLTMSEARATTRKKRGRRQMHDMIAEHLQEDREPTIDEILCAVSACGWHAVAKKFKVSISFTPTQPPQHFEIDLFLRGAGRAWRRLKSRQLAECPSLEWLDRQVRDYVTTGTFDGAAEPWIHFDGNSVRAKESLDQVLKSARSPEAIELAETLRIANQVMAERERTVDLDSDDPNPVRPDESGLFQLKQTWPAWSYRSEKRAKLGDL